MPSKTVFDVPAEDIVSMTVQQIMEKADVKQVTAYKIRKNATAEVASKGAPESLKAEVLAVIKTQAPIEDVATLKLMLKGSPSSYDITRALWGLQKSGDITFYERKRGKDSLLTAIKMSRGVRGAGRQGSKNVIHANGSGKHHVVGHDLTDPKNHGTIANGGPIERSYPEVIPAPPYQVPDDHQVVQRYATPEPPPQNMKPVIDEEIVTENPPEVELPHAEASETHAEAAENTHTQYRDVDVDKFPLIADLMGKKSRLAAYEAAAALLEEADAELALALLEKIQLTDLEKEVIRFVNGDD